VNSADYLQSLQAAMPTGPIWPRDPDAIWTATLSAVADAMGRLDARAQQLIVEADPRTTSELLSDWERVAGLPDRCAGLSPSIQLRRASLVEKLTAVGGQSAAYLISVAAKVGYAVTITEYQVARVGISKAGDALNGQSWAFAFQVHAPATTITQARVGQSSAGDPLASWGNALLQCVIGRRAPAHTIPIYNFVN
jgi:uncharacterized protein YmfQ (DUF2313 family)